ncbi:MAG: type I-U CRISPR-associated protein Cas7 [Gordonia sp. (in: high G+C Gram-positive bacteria)]|uniref:type I-G CRISPR-associated protein Cas7 n=1 Tax=Gordonia sp. (in: high G+C Gram-positive bacteria) TaxID=84139 RepID=UPI0039E5EF7F
MSALYDTVRSIVCNPRAAALVSESTYTPAGGRAKPIAPPTYAGDVSAEFAYTPDAYIPEIDAHGWHTEIKRDDAGRPMTATQVVVNSTPAETGRAEESLWLSQRRICADLTLPGIVVGGPDTETIDQVVAAAIKKVGAGPGTAEKIRAEAGAILGDFEVSTWTAAHRQADAWIKYAATPDGKQIWQGGSIRDLITTASSQHADELYSHFVNAGVYGMWLSSGVSRRHRIPRAYSSEIVGFEAMPVRRAATKLDVGGGAAKETTLNVADGELVEAKGHKPSDLGFGQIPTSPHEAAFVCGSILQQSSISLPVFRTFRFAADDDHRKRDAAATVFTLLAITGHELAAEDGFLRSECSLIREEVRWGWRQTSARGGAGVEEFDVPDADTAAAALVSAVAAAEDVGLRFAAPVTVQLSRAQAAVVAERVAREVTKSTGSSE